MNEVTRIHLGRQQFIVAVDARKALQAYLHDIERHVDNDKEVIKEIELRVAELLVERGVFGDKVVLPEDIRYVRGQLGEPSVFAGETGQAGSAADDKDSTQHSSATGAKQLFRDTDSAMLAGVSSGLANFFGLDPIIIRLLFVVATLTGGAGIFIYILLWILLPEAKSSSDKLRMHGKPVTVDSLKEIVAKADVEGAARRASRYIEPLTKKAITAFRYITGSLVVTASVIGLVIVGVVSSLLVLRHDWLLTSTVFPKTNADIALIAIGCSLVGMIVLFLLLVGVSIIRLKWSLKGWLTATLAGVFCIALAVGIAIAVDSAPRIREAARAQYHTGSKTVPAFQRVGVLKDGDKPVSVRFMVDPNRPYSIEYGYNGRNEASIKTEVVDGVLQIDARKYDPDRGCTGLCLFYDPILRVTVYTPQPLKGDL
jgi:phage shock protein PspC (stress-responsive transcriptional regulator)